MKLVSLNELLTNPVTPDALNLNCQSSVKILLQSKSLEKLNMYPLQGSQEL